MISLRSPAVLAGDIVGIDKYHTHHYPESNIRPVAGTNSVQKDDAKKDYENCKAGFERNMFHTSED